MKKSLILLSSLFFVAFTVNIFTQTYTGTDEYKNGVKYYDDASVDQSNGEYNSSYDLSLLADEQLNLVYANASKELFDAYKNNVSVAKGNADSSISKAKSAGAPTTTATSAYNEASKSQGLISTFEGDVTKESENYKKAMDGYAQASKLADASYDSFIKQNTTTTQNLINQANTKYNSLLKSNIIVKNDANDKSVSAAIAQANNSLKGQNFDAAKNSINAATATMTKAENDNKAKVSQANSVLDASKKKQESLISSNVIVKNDSNDKQITTLHSDAGKLIAQNNFSGSQAKVDEASSVMASAEATNKQNIADAQKELDASKEKRQSLLDSSVIAAGDDDDNQIATFHSDADKSITANNVALSKEKIDGANQFMLDVEQRKADALALATANIEEQLKKIRDMVASLVENDSIDSESEYIYNINNVIDRTIALLSTGQLTEQNIEEAQSNMGELLDTIDSAVADANADSANNEQSISPATLPQYYVVRSKTPADSLWIIAGYNFVYGNPVHWEVLYNANRNLLTDPNNPHIILPGQVIEIPSLAGETRDGVYSPNN